MKELFEKMTFQHITFLSIQTEGELARTICFQSHAGDRLDIDVIETEIGYTLYFPSTAVMTEKERIELSQAFHQTKEWIKKHPSLKLRLLTGVSFLRGEDSIGSINFSTYDKLISEEYTKQAADALQKEYRLLLEKPMPKEDATLKEKLITVAGLEGTLLTQALVERGVMREKAERNRGILQVLQFEDACFGYDPFKVNEFQKQLTAFGYQSRLSTDWRGKRSF